MILVFIVVVVFYPIRQIWLKKDINENELSIKKSDPKISPKLCKKINSENEFADIDATGVYGTLPIVAGSAIVYNATEATILFGKNLKDLRGFASLIKVLTASTSLSIIGEDTLISIQKNALSDYFENFTIGEKWRVKDLASYALITSSNDAARALGIGSAYFFEKEYLHEEQISNKDTVAIFKDAMEQKARHYFMDETVANEIKSMSGLDTKDGKASVTGNILEASQLMLCAFEEYPNMMSTTKIKNGTFFSYDEKIYEATNTNIIINEIPNIIFSKTGYTLASGGNLIISYRNKNNHIILVGVMGSSKDARFTDVLLLTQATQKVLEELEL